MATEHTKSIRNIGRVETTRIVKRTPINPAGEKVTRLVPKHKVGRVVHDSSFGPRRGEFPKTEHHEKLY